tara:strand:+ start:187 stop:441 length:255 start_codon:yes stop_codon:yes gene_type:complete
MGYLKDFNMKYTVHISSDYFSTEITGFTDPMEARVEAKRYETIALMMGEFSHCEVPRFLVYVSDSDARDYYSDGSGSGDTYEGL